jgi:AraC-like DNA-binding protein
VTGFRSIIPEGALGQHVAMIWDCDMPARELALERILPKAGASLIINLAEDETRGYRDNAGWICTRKSGSVLVGPGTAASVIDTNEQQFVAGIEFHPGGARQFFREPLDSLRDADTDLDDLECEASPRLREQLLEAGSASVRLQVLVDWLHAHARPWVMPALICQALDYLNRSPCIERVSDIAAYTGLSTRRLGDLFTESVGMAPKRYLRLQRFRAVTAMTHLRSAINWSAVAADCGFHDQAHLVHEFRAFSGLTPGEWMNRSTLHESHLAIESPAPSV